VALIIEEERMKMNHAQLPKAIYRRLRMGNTMDLQKQSRKRGSDSGFVWFGINYPANFSFSLRFGKISTFT